MATKEKIRRSPHSPARAEVWCVGFDGCRKHGTACDQRRSDCDPIPECGPFEVDAFVDEKGNLCETPDLECPKCGRRDGFSIRSLGTEA